MILTPEYVKEQTGYDVAPQIAKKDSGQEETLGEKEGLSLPVKLLIGVGVTIAALAVLFYAAVRYTLVKKRKRRAARARRRQIQSRRNPNRQIQSRQSAARQGQSRRSDNHPSPARRSRYAAEGSSCSSGRNKRR